MLKADEGSEIKYMKGNNISLQGDRFLLKTAFDEAYKTTFYDACRVWNAVDKSTKKRIRFPHRGLDVAIAPVPEKDTGSNSDSDDDSSDSTDAVNNGNITGDVDEEHLFGDIGEDALRHLSGALREF